ncbi:hypothetical protein HK405_015268, partial [Cladochytrium tenue]
MSSKDDQVAALLAHVAAGEQPEAEALLTAVAGSASAGPQDGSAAAALVVALGSVTDPAGRAFVGISALQYAVWALDWHMWRMLLRHAAPARDAVRDNLAVFTVAEEARPDWMRLHGRHANWDDLIAALDSLADLWDVRNMAAADVKWKAAVGPAQARLPAHVVNEYCHPRRPLDPCPTADFTDSAATLPRSRHTEEGDWYTGAAPLGWLGVGGPKGTLARGDIMFVRAALAAPAIGRARLNILWIGGRVHGTTKDSKALALLQE